MNDYDEHAPDALIEDLNALFGGEVAVPPDVDDAVLAIARSRLRRPGRGRQHILLRLVRSGLAAAAGFLLILWMGGYLQEGVGMRQAEAAALPREDIDMNGQVDILDAFVLAKHVEASLDKNVEWDLNGDGAVDEKDVDTVAMAVVSMDKEVALQ